ncbi:oligosaccharide flippase family protein [Henriciella sp.]|uniref:oligosaccharide flippase family protein n=1 Tax=Henriciella sp. TaxID=1968823 RepID=UPI00260D5545|nr:oligosaccharide flippase family protein [Henriciella sp.]
MTPKEPHKAKKEAGVLAATGMGVRIVSQTMSLALLLIAGRFLTAELFGILVLASIVMNFAMMQMYTGIYHYVLKEPEFEESKETAFTMQAGIAVFFALAILACSALVWLFGGSQLLALLMAATAPVPLGGLFTSWQEATLLRRGEVKYYYGVLMLSEMAGFVAGIAMLLKGGGVWSLIFNRYVSSLSLGFFLAFRAQNLPRFGFRRDQASHIFHYSAGLYGNLAMSFFSQYGAAIILGAFLSTRAVGLFRMGARTATAAYDIFAQTFRVLTWQAVGRMAREERLTATLWTRLLATNLSIMTFVLGSLSILAEPLTRLILGDEWLGMVPILQIICWIRILASIDLVATAQLAAAGESKFLFRTRLVEGALLLVSLLICVQYGMVAVAFGMFLPTAVYVLLMLRKLVSLTKTSVRQVAMATAPGLLLSVVSLVVVFAVSSALTIDSDFGVIALTAVAGLSCYMILAFGPLRVWTMQTLHTVSVAILPAADPAPEPTPASS